METTMFATILFSGVLLSLYILKKNIFLSTFWRLRYFSSIKLSLVNTSSYFSTTQNVQKLILSVMLFFPNQLFFIIRDNAWPMLCVSYSRNPREGRYCPLIYYVIIVDTQHTNILINTNRISESQKIDKNSAVICSGKLSDIINIKRTCTWPSLLQFEFELNMSSSDDLLSQAHNHSDGVGVMSMRSTRRVAIQDVVRVDLVI